MIDRIILLVVLFISLHFSTSGQELMRKSSHPVIVKGKFEGLKKGDSLKIHLFVHRYNFIKTYLEDEKIIGDNEEFEFLPGEISEPSNISFKIDTLTSKGWLSLSIEGFLIEPNDTILIEKKGRHISYLGTTTKISSLRNLKNIGQELRTKRWRDYKHPMLPTKEDYAYLDSITLLQLSYLESIKPELTNTSYALSLIHVLEDNVLRKREQETRIVNKGNQFNLAFSLYTPHPDFPDYNSIKTSLAGYQDKIEPLLLSAVQRYSQYLPYSFYPKMVLYNYIRDYCLRPNQPFDFAKYYSFINSNYKGLFLERLMVEAINLWYKSKGFDKEKYITHALSVVKNNDFKNYLMSIKSGVNGNIAYPFTLPDMNGNIIRLDSLRGKVVILDFWFTGCTYCAKLYPFLERVEDHYSDNPNVVFLSINIDEEKEMWLKSARQGDKYGQYTSIDKKNVINLNTEGLGKQHPMITYHGVMGYPTLIVLDKDSKIQKQPADPRSDSGKGLIAEIDTLLKKITQ